MKQDLFDLTDQLGVVIGATGILGGAISQALAGAGASVAVLGRNPERGRARVGAIRELGGTADFFLADALDRDSLRAAKEKIIQQWGTPTILVNAAGGNDPKVTVTSDLPFEKIPTDDWRASFDLNLTAGALLPCQEFGAAMKDAGRGSIINIASIAAHVPLSRVVAYAAAKSALLNLTQFLAREWAPYGVRVNSITPGFFPGEQNRRLLFTENGSPTERGQAILNHTPLKRFGQPEELAGAVVFLASPAASGTQIARAARTISGQGTGARRGRTISTSHCGATASRTLAACRGSSLSVSPVSGQASAPYRRLPLWY